MNRTRKHLTRITVAGSSVALFAGLAIPAYACTPPDSAGIKPVAGNARPVALTAADLKAKVDSFVARRLADLSAQARRVAASTRLTDPRKATIQARISAEVDALNALKATVDAESTVTAIRADLVAARLAALKVGVDARIDARVARLAAMVAKIQASTRLTDAKKMATVAALNVKIAALTSLKAKVAGETTTSAVLMDLRSAGALWMWRDRDGRQGTKGDPDGRGRAGKAMAAAWNRNSHEAKDSTRARVVAVGRGHASSCAGHHGFEGSHHRHGGGVRHA